MLTLASWPAYLYCLQAGHDDDCDSAQGICLRRRQGAMPTAGVDPRPVAKSSRMLTGRQHPGTTRPSLTPCYPSTRPGRPDARARSSLLAFATTGQACCPW